MAASTNFPGLQEVLDYLQAQRAKTAPSNQLPVAPTADEISANMPRTAKVNANSIPDDAGGIFDAAEGSGGAFARSALSDIATAAPLVPSAWRLGQYLGNKYNELTSPTRSDAITTLPDIPSAPLKTNSLATVKPSVKTSQPAQGKAVTQTSVQPAQPAQVVQGVSPIQQSANLAGMDFSPDEEESESPTDAADVDDRGQVQDVPVTSTGSSPSSVSMTATSQPASEANDFMTQLMQTMSGMPKQTPVLETPNANSVEALNTLTNPPANSATPETLGHKIKRFLVAGSGPLDFSRIDQQEATAKQAQQKFTDPQQLSADLASGDVKGAQQFNRESQLEVQKNQGMTPQMKFVLDLLGTQNQLGIEQSNRLGQIGAEHNARMGEIAAGATAQRLSPDMMRREAATKMVTENPELATPDDIYQVTGLHVSPEALKLLQANHQMSALLAQMVGSRINGGNGNLTPTSNSPTLTTKALQK